MFFTFHSVCKYSVSSVHDFFSKICYDVLAVLHFGCVDKGEVQSACLATSFVFSA